MAGLFFCLASVEGARLLFCSAAIQPHTSVYSAFCSVNAVYAAHATKQRTGLYRSIFCDCTNSTAANTRPTQAAIIPPAPRWNISQRPDRLRRYQIPPPRRTLCRPVQPSYYNKVYKGARVRPVMDTCQTVQHTTDRARLAGQSSGRGAAGGAEPLAATAVSLFGLSPDS